jgi:hypothetical protein
MSSLAERVISVSGPVNGPVSGAAGSAPSLLWIPVAGALWVAANAILVGLGTQIPYPMTCSFLAGIIDGTVLSVIAVAKASARFQAGTTGLLGGVSLSGLRSDGSMIWKAVHAVHEFVGHALIGMGFDNEVLHQQIEQEVLYIIWTTIFVVMASLVVEWVRTTRSES